MKVSVDDLLRAVQRLIKGDFLEPIATDDERKELAHSEPPVRVPKVQDYITWRGSMLLLAAALFILASLFELIGFQTAETQMVDPMIEQTRKQAEAQGQSFSERDEERMREQMAKNFGEGNMATLNWYAVLILLGTLALTVLAVLSALNWRKIHVSRRFARTAWYVAVGVPLLLAVIPWTKMMSFDHMGPQGKQIKMIVAALFALQMFGTIGPKVLSIFPGLMRAGMTLKTLFFESATPAYFTVLGAPIFAMILLMLFSTVIQMQGTASLFFAVIFLLASAVVYLVKSGDLLRSHTREEAGEKVKAIRRLAGVLAGIGILFLIVFLFDFEGISFSKALSFLIIAGANLLLTMVVASDFLIAILQKEYELAKAFQGTELAEAYEKKIKALAAAGMTTLSTVKAKEKTEE